MSIGQNVPDTNSNACADSCINGRMTEAAFITDNVTLLLPDLFDVG